MHSDIEKILYKAEDVYLDNQDMAAYRYNVAAMADSLETYRLLRDREVEVFQVIADELEEEFPNVTQAELETAIKQWILILRSCAMAMILNNPDYLTLRLDNWFKDILRFQTLADIDKSLYQFLGENLREILSQKQYDRIKPFLLQVRTSLIKPLSNTLVAATA